MILKIAIIILSVALMAMMSAVMDKLQFHFRGSIFAGFKNPQFWNPEVSWKNKYKNGDSDQGPKFPGSTSIFVSFTDAWHLAKKVFTAALAVPVTLAIAAFLPVVVGWWWLAVWVGVQLLFGAAFHLCFHNFFSLKAPKE